MPPLANRHCALALDDVMPGLLKLVRRHVWDRSIIAVKDCSVEVPVLVVARNHRTARTVINRDPVRENVTTAIHIILEPRETPDARPPAPPRLNIAPHHVLLMLGQCYLGHGAPSTAVVMCGAWALDG